VDTASRPVTRSSRPRGRFAGAAVAAAGLLALLALVLLGGLQAPPAGAAQSTTATPDAVQVVQEVSPAVVTVINRQQLDPESESPTDAGSGTGFFIDDQGHIVTNEHVVRGGGDFVVTLADGEARQAELVGTDPVSDLAVLRVDGDVPAVARFGDSDALLPGETVLAIGSPLGAFTNTVTEGIVSAIGRTDPGFQGDDAVYTNLIQHDAAINPGNSGGPLFNLAGEVVGVNTLGIPVSDQGVPVQGLFFAVPASTVQTVVADLVEDGEVIYPFFGVASLPNNDQLVLQFDLEVDDGEVVIQEVDPSTPAGRAGIEAGDVILEIDGQPIDAQNPFVEVLFAHEPGETVAVTVQRGDETFETEVTLDERPVGR
jgi:2-alkenal reductase